MKILFACVAAEGHISPLTGIAVHLRDRGQDVRWYTGASLAPVVARMGLAFHPFRAGRRDHRRNHPRPLPRARRTARPRIDPVRRREDHSSPTPTPTSDDITHIHAGLDFDLLFCDSAFYGARPVKHLLAQAL